MGKGAMSKELENEIVQIAAFTQARELVTRAICRSHLPCTCDQGRTCHAGLIYRPEAEAVLSALTKAGLFRLASIDPLKGERHD